MVDQVTRNRQYLSQFETHLPVDPTFDQARRLVRKRAPATPQRENDAKRSQIAKTFRKSSKLIPRIARKTQTECCETPACPTMVALPADSPFYVVPTARWNYTKRSVTVNLLRVLPSFIATAGVCITFRDAYK